MESKEYSTRRAFISKCAGTGATLFGTLLLLYGCGDAENKQSPSTGGKAETTPVADPCNDFTGVSTEELEKRKKLGYVEKSEVPESNCANCGLYLPPPNDAACGGCLLFKGPVHAEGHCIQWVAKAQ